MGNMGLMFECDILPSAEVPVTYRTEFWDVDTSYVNYDISWEKAARMMSIAISGYVRF